MSSLWEKQAQRKTFENLGGDTDTEVLIIGGGIAGLLSAYMLQQADVKYLLVEEGRIVSGVSANTTAKITMQHGLLYSKMLSEYGVEYASLYAEAQIKALDMYNRICQNIDCDYEICDSYVYSVEGRKKLEKELRAIEKIGIDTEFQERTELPFHIDGALRMRNQARFNPLKFLLSVAEELNIRENTKVLKIEKNTAFTNRGNIRAEKIIVATHFPMIYIKGLYFLKMYQHRSYVIGLENAAKYSGVYVDEAKCGMSFRNYGDVLLIGGGDHKTGKRGGGYRELRAFRDVYYPESKEVCRYATQDCITLDGIPYIGRYSSFSKDLFVITGFNKWGISSAMAGAMLLCDLVRDRGSDYTPIFSPTRQLEPKQLIINIASSAMGLLKPTAPRCSHLGCALKYNKSEHTWDCPCHGSRFSEEGNVIENPAKRDIDIKRG